ncbi:N(alpha)-acetyltransferase 25, NatB auxiliary subunit [Camelus ferus]|nr:N(alpha)-acetyltransferase 25, NatB auxiliary subunit [Camelus ferus]
MGVISFVTCNDSGLPRVPPREQVTLPEEFLVPQQLTKDKSNWSFCTEEKQDKEEQSSANFDQEVLPSFPHSPVGEFCRSSATIAIDKRDRRWPFNSPFPGACPARAHCGSALVIMATRGHVQDPNDRRLRPIYDYLDNGNNKMAIQQADKLLKKHKDLHCAKVLKAIGLQRTGKQEEAFILAQEVAALEPTDDNSLQALTILYREMHRPELVTKLYEAAVKKVPNSEEYHSHLFMAYARVGEYKKMQQVCLVRFCSDDWQFYLTYFDSVFRLIEEAWTPPAEGEHSLEGEVHYSAEEAVKFIEDRITEESKSSRHLRGPHLAKLELIRRLRHQGFNDEYKLGDPEELMFQYFKKFGDKPCCFTDLKVFVDLLPATQCTKFINQLLGVVPLSTPTEDKLALPADIRALQQHLCVVQLTRLLGLYHTMDKNQKLSVVRELMLSYLLTRYAESLGQYAAASQSCNFALRFFHSNQKDTSEYIIQAYKYGAFEKIPEFIAFRNRLNNSLHFAQVRTERMLLDLLLEANITASLAESIKSMNLRPEEDDIPWEALRDNRDLNVFFSWDPKDRDVSEEDKKLSLEEETMWLRIRSLTLRLISGLSSLNHSVEPKNSEKTTENGVSSRIDILRLLLQQLEVALETGKRFIEREIKYPFLGPVPTRMAGFFNSGCSQCQTSSFYLVSDIYELDTNGLETSGGEEGSIKAAIEIKRKASTSEQLNCSTVIA